MYLVWFYHNILFYYWWIFRFFFQFEVLTNHNGYEHSHTCILMQIYTIVSKEYNWYWSCQNINIPFPTLVHVDRQFPHRTDSVTEIYVQEVDWRVLANSTPMGNKQTKKARLINIRLQSTPQRFLKLWQCFRVIASLGKGTRPLYIPINQSLDSSFPKKWPCVSLSPSDGHSWRGLRAEDHSAMPLPELGKQALQSMDLGQQQSGQCSREY